MPIPAALLPFLAQGAMEYGPGIVRGIGRGARYVGGGLADRLQGLGQQYLPQGVQNVLGGIGGFANAVLGNEPQQMTPEQIAQQNYLQQIQQPFQLGSAQRQQQLLNQFNQQIIPGLAERFSGMGGQRSSAFGQQLGQAGGDFLTNLGALQEQNALQEGQLNQQRLGQLGGYLGGQQQLGLQAQQLGQAGTIAQRDAQLRGMGLMQQANQAQQGFDLQRLLGRGELQGRLAGLGLGRQFDVLRHGGAPANIIGLAQGAGQGAQAAAQLF